MALYNLTTFAAMVLASTAIIAWFYTLNNKMYRSSKKDLKSWYQAVTAIDVAGIVTLVAENKLRSFGVLCVVAEAAKYMSLITFIFLAITSCTAYTQWQRWVANR